MPLNKETKPKALWMNMFTPVKEVISNQYLVWLSVFLITSCSINGIGILRFPFWHSTVLLDCIFGLEKINFLLNRKLIGL